MCVCLLTKYHINQLKDFNETYIKYSLDVHQNQLPFEVILDKAGTRSCFTEHKKLFFNSLNFTEVEINFLCGRAPPCLLIKYNMSQLTDFNKTLIKIVETLINVL